MKQFPFFFSHDGKETKDLAPSMLPPSRFLAKVASQDLLYYGHFECF
jgi:hypothetical protein